MLSLLKLLIMKRESEGMEIILLCLLSSLLTTAAIFAFSKFAGKKAKVSDWVVGLAIYKCNSDKIQVLPGVGEDPVDAPKFQPVTLGDINPDAVQFLVAQMFLRLQPEIMQSQEARYLALYLLTLIYDCSALGPANDTELLDDMRLLLAHSYREV